MNDVQEMFQTILKEQKTFRQEVLNRFDQIDQRFESIENELSSLKRELAMVGLELNKRIDKLGKQLAYL